MNESAKRLCGFVLLVITSVWIFSSMLCAHVRQEKPTQEQIVTVETIYSEYFPAWEVTEIMDACHRNGLDPHLIPVVFAIRKAENGRPELAFGIMNPEADTYSKQAGWAVCTVQKNYDRWLKNNQGKEFIDFLGDRYCPASVDPEGNENWKHNVIFWVIKLGGVL